MDRIIHDRFIVLDGRTVYIAGGSSKDAGKKMTTIIEIIDESIKRTLLDKLAKVGEIGEFC